MQRLIPIALIVCGCGGAAEELPPPELPKSIQPAPVEPAKPPPGSLWREEVTETVEDGLGFFLQRVEVAPEVRAGRFEGFRIVQLHPADWWKGVDLKPGDVILSVNGMPIERETEAFAAFESLRTAQKLRVSYLRGGKQRELVYSIVARDSKSSPADKAPDPPASKPVPGGKSTGA